MTAEVTKRERPAAIRLTEAAEARIAELMANAPESAAARIKRVFFIGYGYGFGFAVSLRVQSTKLISQRTQSNSSR